jgi:hypothetical protein
MESTPEEKKAALRSAGKKGGDNSV